MIGSYIVWLVMIFEQMRRKDCAKIVLIIKARKDLDSVLLMVAK
jgi:hypothetical protein